MTETTEAPAVELGMCFNCETTITEEQDHDGLCAACDQRENDWQTFTAQSERAAREGDQKLLWNAADQLADMTPEWWASLPCAAMNVLHPVLLANGFVLDAAAATYAHIDRPHTHELSA